MVDETTETLLRRIAELEQLLRNRGGVPSSRPRRVPRSRSPRSCSPLALPTTSSREAWYEMSDGGDVELAENEVAECMVDKEGESSDEETVTTPAYNLDLDLEVDDDEIPKSRINSKYSEMSLVLTLFRSLTFCSLIYFKNLLMSDE